MAKDKNGLCAGVRGEVLVFGDLRIRQPGLAITNSRHGQGPARRVGHRPRVVYLKEAEA
jgi:hypothetical protein